MIYLLEDDSSIRELVAYTLTNTLMPTVGFERPSELRAALEREMPALVILDIMLPEEDGISVLRSLRESPRTEKLPVMMLTAKSTEYDKVIGLDCGADDYLTKPFGMMELVARVRALLRRTEPSEKHGSALHCGALTLDAAKHLVTVGGAEVELTRKEFDLLQLMLSHPQQVFTRDRLLTQIWGYEFDGESRTVDVHIRSLRQKLGAAGRCIETVRGVGYRMGGTV